MAFQRKNNSGTGERRVMSDVRKPAKKMGAVKSAPERARPKPKTKKIHTVRSGRVARYFLGGLAASAIALIIAFFTSSLTLVVVPKKTAFELGKGISVTVPADAIEVSAFKKGEAQSKTSREFNNKAKGTIVIFNSFSSSPQVLVATTRFETPDGLVYRLPERTVVPGKNGDKPGSIEAVVVAGGIGDKYNIGLTDFTIPGFKGSPKYKGFYARSKTQMKGGAVGKGKVVGEEEANELFDKLSVSVKSELKSKIAGAMPEGFIYFPEALNNIETEKVTDPEIGSPADTFFGEVRATLKTMAVDKAAYEDALAKLLFRDRYSKGAYMMHESSDIKVKSVKLDFDRKQMTVNLSGRAVFEWLFDKQALKDAVLAASGTPALKDIFGSYKAISRVEAVYSPRFIRKIPSSAGRLHIQVSD